MKIKERQKIRKRLRDSFRWNKFPRPTHCGYCGIKCKTEAHHFKYTPEDYVWVCKDCHSHFHLGFTVDGEGNKYR